MLSLKLRGDTYYVVGQVNGKRVRKTTKTSDKEIANHIRIQMEHEMVTGRRSSTTQKSFSDAVESYLKRRDFTSNTTIRYLSKFMDEWDGMTIDQINQTFLEDWLDERLDAVTGPTVRREFNAFMPVIRHARKRGWIDEVPDIERPADGEPRLRVLNEDEYWALTKGYSKEHDHAWGLTQFLLLTGARIGEAIALKYKDVHFTEQEPYVVLRTRKRKGGKEDSRVVPLVGVLIKNAMAHREATGQPAIPDPEEWLFPRWRDQRAAGKAVIRFAESVGVNNFRPHDCRRTFATRLLERGTNPRTVADLLGHTSLTMVMRYMVPPSHVKQDAVNALVM